MSNSSTDYFSFKEDNRDIIFTNFTIINNLENDNKSIIEMLFSQPMMIYNKMIQKSDIYSKWFNGWYLFLFYITYTLFTI